MKTRKDLKPGDTCLICSVPLRSGQTLFFLERTVGTVGRKWIRVSGFANAQFCIVSGCVKSDFTPRNFLYASMEEYEATQGEKDRREALRQIIVAKNLHFGIGDLTTEAAERIVAILQDPASKLPT